MTRKKIEKLYSRGLLVRRDVERVYEGLYLDAITSLEATIEDLFIRIITGRSLPTEVVVRVSFNSSQVARDVMLGGERRYLDWFPYDRTEKRAKAFLRGGRPFTQLSTTDKKVLKEMLIIRNAIAHKSHHSRKKFKDFVVNFPLISRERTPAGFLHSRIDPTTTRYQYYASEMIRIIQLLSQ
ncbi:hypothetical protein [Rhodocaloribacter sp.]